MCFHQIPRNHSPNSNRIPQSPTPPPHSAHEREILCDGSFSQSSPLAGYGIIIKDSHGRIIDGNSGTLVCSFPIVAEAKALHTAIGQAVATGLPTVIKTDCLNLVDALRRDPTVWPWQCSAWLHLMSQMLISNPQIRVSFTPRSHNLLADRVAKAAAAGSARGDWPSISSLLNLNL
ncbi:hypothetical protein LINPERHAP2_LOCUS34238 [Linum perenne]